MTDGKSISSFSRCDTCEKIVVDLAAHKESAHNEKTDYKLQTCEHCGQEFERDRRSNRFCSRSCASEVQAQETQ